MEDGAFSLKTTHIKSVLIEVPRDKNHVLYNERKPKNLKLLESEVKIKNIQLFFQGNPQVITAGAQATSTAITVTTAAVLGANPATAISMIKIMQCMDLLKIINIPKLPANFVAFLELFKNNMFDVMPNFMSRDESAGDTVAEKTETANQTATRIMENDFSEDFSDVKSNNKFCNLHPKFASVDLNCMILNNSGEIGTMVLGLLFLKLLLKLIVSCVSRNATVEKEQMKLEKEALESKAVKKASAKTLKQTKIDQGKDKDKATAEVTTQETQAEGSKAQKIILKAESFFGFAMLVDTIIAIQTDVIVAALINLKYFWITPFILWINSCIAFVIFTFYLWFVQHMLRKSYTIEVLRKNKEMSREEKKQKIEELGLAKYRFVKGDLESKRTVLAGMTNELLILKDLLVAMFIVLFVNYPIFQILPPLAMFGTAVIFIFKNKVFKNKLVYYTILLNELTFCVITLVFFLYYMFGGSMSMSARYNFFGWGLISLILITVVLNMIIGIASFYITIKELCCKKKNEKQVDDVNEAEKRANAENEEASLP